MEKFHICPRRVEIAPHLHHHLPESDEWISRDGLLRCSHCGSMHPQATLDAIEVGAKLTPTDKSYKIYLDLPHPNPTGMRVYTMTNQDMSGQPDWIQATPENLAQYDVNGFNLQDIDWFKVCMNSQHINAQFYFQHFSEEQRQQFVDLMNAGKIDKGMLYVMTFFIAPAA